MVLTGWRPQLSGGLLLLFDNLEAEKTRRDRPGTKG